MKKLFLALSLLLAVPTAIGAPGNDRIVDAVKLRNGSYTMTLPTADGTNGQVLKTNGSGVWSFVTSSGGGITELTGDVTAGPGSGSQAAMVVGIQGVQVNSSPPDPSAVLTYDGVGWTPAIKVGAGGADYFSWASALVTVHGDGIAGGRLKLNHFGNARGTTLYSADSLAANSDFKFPPTNGTTGHCLKNTDGAGGTEWAACGGGGGGADTDLSNLASPTAINTALDFGASVSGVLRTADNGAGTSTSLILVTGNSSDVSGTVDIISGDGTNGSGQINLTPGNLMSAVNRGWVQVNGQQKIGTQPSATNAKLTISNSIAEAAVPAIAFRISDADTFGWDIQHETAIDGDLRFLRLNGGGPSEAFSLTRAAGNARFQGSINGAGNLTLPTGKIGIGTGDPQRDLDITSTEPTFMLWESDASADQKGMQFVLSANVFYWQFLDDSYAGSEFLRVTRSGNTPTNMTFPQGSVYFGTADGTVVADASPNFIFTTQTPNHTTAFFGGPGDDGGLAFITVSDGSFYLQATASNNGTGSGATPLMLNPQGSTVNLGSGAGSVLLTGYGDGDLSVAGTVIVSSSDARLKDVQRKYTPGLDALGFDPVVFKWKPETQMAKSGAQETIGFLAQDVEQYIPEAVRYDKAGMRSLNKDAILATMLNAIKELKAEVEELKRNQVKQ